MKKIGIIGGLGPKATLYYYQMLMKFFLPSAEETGFPEITIESLDYNEVIPLFQKGEYDQLIEIFSRALHRLSLCGVDIGCIASNTPHIIFGELSEISPFPLVNIVDESLRVVQNAGVWKPLILGSSITMDETFFQREAFKKGIEMVAPSLDDQYLLEERLHTDFFRNSCSDKTKRVALNAVHKAMKEFQIDGVIWAYAELPSPFHPGELPLYTMDTADVHIKSLVERATI